MRRLQLMFSHYAFLNAFHPRQQKAFKKLIEGHREIGGGPRGGVFAKCL